MAGTRQQPMNWFLYPSNAVSASLLSSSSSEPTPLGTTAFLAFIPRSFDGDGGMGDDAWLHGAC